MSYSTIDKEAQPIVSEAPSYYSKKFLAGAVAIAFVMGAAAATATASVPAVSTSTYFDRADISPTNRGDAAAATWIVRGSRRRRGCRPSGRRAGEDMIERGQQIVSATPPRPRGR